MPSTEGFEQLSDPSAPIQCGSTVIGFDNATGSIAHLLDQSVSPPMQWASDSRMLLKLGYRTYSQEDFTTFQKQYSNLSSPPGLLHCACTLFEYSCHLRSHLLLVVAAQCLYQTPLQTALLNSLSIQQTFAIGHTYSQPRCSFCVNCNLPFGSTDFGLFRLVCT